MKLRTKLVLACILVIAIALCICSTFLLHKSFRTSLERETNRCINENEMINYLIETKILNLILQDDYIGVNSLTSLTLVDDSLQSITQYALVTNEVEVVKGAVPDFIELGNLVSSYS